MNRLGVAVGLGALLAAGCTSDPEYVPPAGGEFQLVSYDSCEQAERQLRAAATGYVGPWGFGGPELFAEGDAATAAEAAPAAPDAARGAAPSDGAEQAADPDYSGTNVHESGVDEPDLVKTDGERIVTVTAGTLRVVDLASRIETGRLDLRANAPGIEEDWWQPADLLLYGDHALVLVETGWWGGFRDGPDLPEPAAPEDEAPIVGPRLLLVDLTGDPRVASEYTIDGGLVDARAVDGTARVVVRSAPRIEFPESEGSSDAARTAANKRVIESAEVTDWLPRYQVTTAGQADAGQVDCAALSHPESYSGTSMLTVLTFDLAAPDLGDGAPVSVVADGDTVYSNGTSLYVASDQRWAAEPEVDRDTVIYKFDTSQPGQPRYVAAGAVDGWLINQYAMSEWEEHLRVATTDDAAAESTVYVLAERDGELVETGSVGGLGKDERIYSVRFAGPIGYLVTFRETDPLYTLDLRDPAAPAALGELKITGYSAYLHPLEDGRLVGIGQEADEQGVIQGTQVSLFDVSDLADPNRLAQHHIEDAHSEAEFDPHAFLWWPAEQLLVVPLSSYDGETGAVALRVGDDDLTELSRISHPGGQIRRSLVVGDTLWTVSDAGLQANALSTLDSTGWIPFT